MFTITGYAHVAENVVRRAEITWWEPEGRPFVTHPDPNGGWLVGRGLDGDFDLCLRALIDEGTEEEFCATPTGPCYRADLDDPTAAFVQLASYFLDGYEVSGNPPWLVVPIPVGAVA